ncbi:hypothetical protein B0H16DRAFT_1568414 [Mycena metata]|uniref:F-box domain-containing protein n=1 Tax=Mycena metata TaxID=1033252 RepID=A0AAD7MZZ4_9AGAR|nr:hypothetical protein B0H16DRAFT_1568414 [Mycena metata]
MVNVCKPCSKIIRAPVPAVSNPELLTASLEEIKSAISQHKACLTALETREREIAQRLTRGLTVYPVLALPNEIVSRIFIQCLPSHGRVRPSRRRAPLLLAQICRHWREIALSTCQLWAAVDINAGFIDLMPGARNNTIQRGLPLIQTWFSRAMACPLSLTIRSSKQKLPVSIYPIISTVAERLHRLELSLLDEDVASLQQLSISLPHLQHLAICSDKMRPFSIFPSTPRVHDLYTSQISVSELGLYPNLTRLQLSTVSLKSLLQILQSRPKIICVAARLAPTAVDSSISAPPPLKHLSSLTLYGRNAPKAVESALKLLTLPNLHHLELHVELELNPDSLLTFFSRSACALDHLTLGFNYSRTFQGCLAALPLLKSLEVEVNHRTMVHFRELLDTRALVPRLAALSMRVDTEDLDYAAFGKSLAMRRRHNPDFQSLRLDIHQDSYDDDDADTQWLPRRAKQVFERLMADGLQIQVNWESEEGWPERWVDPCETFY